MRIAIAYLSGGGMSGGAVTTLRHQLPKLRNHPAVTTVATFVPPTSIDRFPGELGLATWPARDPYLGFRYLRDRLRDFRADVLFIPTAAILALDGVPCVCMVRNSEPFVRAGEKTSWRDRLRNRLRRARTKHACRGADRVTAVSKFVKELVVRQCGVAEQRIDVVSHGVVRVTETLQPAALREFLPGSFLFAAGSLLPYRGLEDVIRVLAEETAVPRRLVIAGRSENEPKYERSLRRLADELGVASRIVWLGHRPAAELAWCYDHCAAFVMTSRTEACPNVVLESLAHGSLAITTSSAPMPEFYGPTALVYEAGSVSGLASQLRILDALTPRQRAARAARAQDRARDYSWDRNVAATVAVLQKASSKMSFGIRQAA